MPSFEKPEKASSRLITFPTMSISKTEKKITSGSNHSRVRATDMMISKIKVYQNSNGIFQSKILIACFSSAETSSDIDEIFNEQNHTYSDAPGRKL